MFFPQQNYYSVQSFAEFRTKFNQTIPKLLYFLLLMSQNRIQFPAHLSWFTRLLQSLLSIANLIYNQLESKYNLNEQVILNLFSTPSKVLNLVFKTNQKLVNILLNLCKIVLSLPYIFPIQKYPIFKDWWESLILKWIFEKIQMQQLANIICIKLVMKFFRKIFLLKCKVW